MRLSYLSLLGCFLGLLAPVLVRAQCNPTAAEIPHNGFDEDCDGLDDIFLTLPPYIYMVEGQDFELYFRNVILSKHPLDYVFSVNTPLNGQNLGQKWAFTPAGNNIGEFPISITVKSNGGQTLASAASTVRISPAAAPPDMSTKRLLLLGHSFFDQGYLPEYIYERTHQPGNPPITFHGKRQSWANALARHEGHGGKQARWFYQDPDSPVRYGGKVNMRQYFNEVVCPGCGPDWMVFHLDINEFCAYSSLIGTTLQEIDDSIVSGWNRYSTRLIDSVRVASPNTKIAICFSPMPNARESAFQSTYGGYPVLNDRWRWQKIISRLLFKNVERYGNREAENIYLIPEHLDLDDFAEYSPIDALHPEPFDNDINTHCGYMEIAKSIYAWIRWVEFHPNSSPVVLHTYFHDADGDGYGNAVQIQMAASAPLGYVGQSGDCNDNNPNVHPGAVEVCSNNIDDDCDGAIDEDFIAPIAGCLGTVQLPLDASGAATLTVAQVNQGSFDACSAVTFSLSKNHFSCVDLGTNTVTLHLQDASGNSNFCESAIKVVDVLPPVPSCHSTVQLPLDASGAATLTVAQVNQGSFDACSAVTFSLSKSHFSCVDLGTNTVTLHVQDAAGNASFCESAIKVVDVLPPVSSCHSTVQLPLDASGAATLTVAQVNQGSFDACSAVTFSLSKSHFSCVDIGIDTVTLHVQDAAGNASFCKTAVQVVDLLPPVLSCHSTVQLPLDTNGEAILTVAQVNQGSFDACSAVTFSLSQSHFSCVDLGIDTVTLHMQDAAGNASFCKTAVQIVDVLTPVSSCQNTVQLLLDTNGEATLTVAQVNQGSFDACSAVTFSLSQSHFSCVDLGIDTVTLQVQDAAGNASFCKTAVQVVDLLAPVLICPDLSLDLGPSGQRVVSAAELGAQATDNCGPTTWQPFNDLHLTCQQANTTLTFVLTAQDNSVNIATCVVEIFVTDTTDVDGDGISNCLDACPNDSATASLLPFFIDADLDGFGNGEPILACSQPAGTSINNLDCDDQHSTIYPGATEVMNGLDDDCNGIIDDIIVNTSNLLVSSRLMLFPNPAHDRLWLECQSGHSITTIWMIKPTGQLVRMFGVKDFSRELPEIDVSSLEAGLYWVRVRLDNGEEAMGRFLKI